MSSAQRCLFFGVFVCLVIISSTAFASSQENQVAVLINKKQCDAAESYAHKNLKGSVLPYWLGVNEGSCRGNKEAGVALIKQSAQMGNAEAKKTVAIWAKNQESAKQQKQVLCDEVFGYDAMFDEQIKETQDIYGNLLDRLSDQRLQASLAGAGGRSWTWAQGMQQASAPYDNKINQVILERDNKISKLKYEQKKLRYDNRDCYP